MLADGKQVPVGVQGDVYAHSFVCRLPPAEWESHTAREGRRTEGEWQRTASMQIVSETEKPSTSIARKKPPSYAARAVFTNVTSMAWKNRVSPSTCAQSTEG